MPITIGMGESSTNTWPGGLSQLPTRVAFRSVSAMAVDSYDRVYVFNR